MDYFFTADEHFGHHNIINYCNRPFKSVDEMDEIIIENFNKIVSDKDILYHLGDFTLAKREIAENYIKRLNGKHVFIQGSHDYWAKGKRLPFIIEKKINKKMIIMCHYQMTAWRRSHYGSYNLYGHSHGNSIPNGLQWDVGVDTHNFFPYSFEEILDIMENER